MSELSLPQAQSQTTSGTFMGLRLAWRNLWRNPKRTWLTAGGIAFAILLVSSFKALQLGSYVQMKALATSLLTGHVQIQTEQYIDDPSFRETLSGISALLPVLQDLPQVDYVLPRIEAFALVSVGERSFGAQILGVDVDQEAQALRYLKTLSEGRLPTASNEVVIGEVLARNLRAKVGDELVVLGSGKEGGVAALASNIVGLVATGMTDLDRAIVVAPRVAVQEAFYLQDEVQTIVLVGADPSIGPAVQQRVQQALGLVAERSSWRARSWQKLLPDVEQSIELDRVSADIMYYIILGLVAFTIVNSFVMTIFERTREFGMLLAIGMRPGSIVGLLQWESFFIWLLGATIGLGIAITLVALLANIGIPLGESVSEMAAQMYMPTRLFPTLDSDAFTIAPVVLLVGSLLAALIASLRIYSMRPVEAMRHV